MSDERPSSDERLSEEARLAREELAALRTSAPADPEFRARMRREFAAGAIAEGVAAGAPTSATADGSSRMVALPRRRSAPARMWAWAGAIAAAVLVAIALKLNRGPGWRVVSVSGSGMATVNGAQLPMNAPARFAELLVPGATVRVPAGGTLEISCGRMLAIQMAAGTEAVVPRVPGRWFGRTVQGRIAAGEWRITTGAEFPGARFEITTPSARVEVTGTTLAVICQPEGTCVCVYEGHVRVGRGPSDMLTVVSGRRRYVYADTSRVPLDDAMLPPERPALGGFCETMRPLLRRPR